MAKRRIVGSLREVAQHFGVALQTVKQAWRQTGLPGRPGAWDLDAIAAWKGARKRDPGTQSIQSQDRRAKLLAEIRIHRAEADRRELENRIADGGMVRRDNVDREVAELIITTRTALRRIPRRLMPKLPQDTADDLAAEIMREIDDELMELAKWRPTPTEDPPPFVLFE